MTRSITLPYQTELSATQRIEAELREKMRFNTDPNGWGPGVTIAERLEAAEAAAQQAAQQAADDAAALAAQPPTMAPNPAQGSSAGGHVPTVPKPTMRDSLAALLKTTTN